MIRADFLFYTEEATRHLVEEDGKVISMVDVAAGATRLAMSHKGGGGLEILEAFGTLHAYYAVFAEDVFVEVGFDVKVLPVIMSAISQLES
jgi:hypothetical protein